MFVTSKSLSAVAKPRYDTTRKMIFDGRIGILPFIKLVPAHRRSAKRDRGVLEMKLLNVTKEGFADRL
jgi:hypothetical protein